MAKEFKTDWALNETVMPEDMNRIEENAKNIDKDLSNFKETTKKNEEDLAKKITSHNHDNKYQTYDYEGNATYPRLKPNKGDYIRVGVPNGGGLLPYATNESDLGTIAWPFRAIYGSSIFENGKRLSEVYAPFKHNHNGTYQAYDYEGNDTYSRLKPVKGTYIRVGVENGGGLIPYAANQSFLGTAGWPFKSIYGNTIFENGKRLSDVYSSLNHNHDDLYPKKNMDLASDFDSCLEEGTYWTFDGNVANSPVNLGGKLVVYSIRNQGLNNWIFQMFFGTDNKIYVRSKIDNMGWLPWKTILTETNGGLIADFVKGGSHKLSGRDYTIHDKRAIVGFNAEDGDKLYVNFENDFKNGVEIAGLLYNNGLKLLNESNLTGKIGDSGYQKFPSGLILQWGNIFKSFRGNQSGAHYIDINYPIAFPKKAIVAIAIPVLNQYDVGKVKWLCQTNEYNYTSPAYLTFRAAIETGGGETTLGLSWFAIGF